MKSDPDRSFPAEGGSPLVPVLVVVLVVSVLILAPLRILGGGYLPTDDALRHAAKVISGKSWDQVLVLRPDITIDPHQGWHTLLGWVHGLIGGNPESLVVFSVLFLFLLYTLLPLPFLRRPEAWLLSLGVITLATANRGGRLLLGRPYLISMAVVVFLCLHWERFRAPRKHPVAVVLLTLGIAVSTWSHCAWYLWPLPVLCFLLAREWKAALTVGSATVVGVMLGGIFTGHPIEFLSQAVHIARLGMVSDALTRQLVVEFHPSAGDFSLVIAVVLLLLWRKQRGAWTARCFDNPVLYLGVVGWILGLKVNRFWSDWGMPAVTVWMMGEFQEALRVHLHDLSWRRLAVGAAAGAVFFFALTADLQGRWTDNLTIEFLDASKPELQPWLPGPGGIFYNDQMSLFYHTFYRNPRAEWRYILGFEPGLMPPDDLDVYRRIQWNNGAAPAYEPWVNTLRPIDRLVVRSPAMPKIPELEWHYAATGIWIGRLPRPRS